MNDDPQDAAEKAVAPDRLLMGEDPNTPHLADALIWASSYAELMSFKSEILDTTRHHAETMNPASRKEVEETDLPVLEAEAARLQRRLAFWQGRVSELRGDGPGTN